MMIYDITDLNYSSGSVRLYSKESYFPDLRLNSIIIRATEDAPDYVFFEITDMRFIRQYKSGGWYTTCFEHSGIQEISLKVIREMKFKQLIDV